MVDGEPQISQIPQIWERQADSAGVTVGGSPQSRRERRGLVGGGTVKNLTGHEWLGSSEADDSPMAQIDEGTKLTTAHRSSGEVRVV